MTPEAAFPWPGSRREKVALAFAALVVAATATVAASAAGPEIAAAILILAFGLFVVCASASVEPGLVLPLAYLVRVAALLFHAYIAPLPFRAADAQAFDALGFEWSREGLLGAIRHFTTGARLYSWFLALLYSVLGHSSLMAVSVNALLGALVVRNVARASREIWSASARPHPTWLAAFYPSLVLFSALLLREMLLAYLFSRGTLSLLRWWREQSMAELVRAAGFYLLATAIHTGMVMALLFLLLCMGWVGARSLVAGPLRRFVRNAWISAVAATLIVALLSSGWGLEKLGGARAVSFELIANAQENRTQSRAAYLASVTVRSPADLVRQTPLRILYFCFAPFPWQVSSTSDLLGLMDAAIFAVLSAWALRASLRSRSAQARLLILLFFLVLVPFALVTSNYGTALRHRAKLVPLLLVLTGWSGARESESASRRLA